MMTLWSPESNVHDTKFVIRFCEVVKSGESYASGRSTPRTDDIMPVCSDLRSICPWEALRNNTDTSAPERLSALRWLLEYASRSPHDLFRL